MSAMGVGIIGAGVISETYLEHLTAFPDLEVRFVADLDVERARTRAEEHGVAGAGPVDALLDDDGIDIVVNLTLPAAHTEVDLAILAAGKHVWSEKPIALDRADAKEALGVAEAAGLRLAVAPDTVLGPGMQTARRTIESGRIGTPLTGVSMVLNPGPDIWHPAPEFLFQRGGGPLLDLGPYHLSALIGVFGSVARVSAVASTAREQRTVARGPRAGTRFAVEVPTFAALLLEFADGGAAQSTFSFQSALRRPGFLEVTGSEGALELPDPNEFDGVSLLHTVDPEADPHDRPLPERIPSVGVAAGRGTGVLELARSIRAGTPERASGRLAAHVLDVMLGAAEAIATHSVVDVESRIDRPEPLPADWNPFERTFSA